MKRCEVEELAREGSAIYFYTHPDLKALAIGGDDEDDFQEAVYAVNKYWLATAVKEMFGVDDIQDWLENEYTTDDSIQIFYRACEEKQIHLFQIDP